MDSKGFFNIELLISLLLFLIISSMLIALTTQEYKSIEETQNRKEARLITSDISEIINDVYIKGDSYSRRYILPEKINQETYILQINNSGVYLNSHYQISYSKFFSKIKIKPEKVFLQPGNIYEFKNNNNTIEIYQLY